MLHGSRDEHDDSADLVDLILERGQADLDALLPLPGWIVLRSDVEADRVDIYPLALPDRVFDSLEHARADEGAEISTDPDRARQVFRDEE